MYPHTCRTDRQPDVDHMHLNHARSSFDARGWKCAAALGSIDEIVTREIVDQR